MKLLYITLCIQINWLSGQLPGEIGSFSRMRYLQLDNNSLSGSIPMEIGRLSNLTIVFLDDNEFTGVLPDSMGRLVKLETIFLDNNQLSGPIPQGFTNFSNLQALDIFNNHFDSLPDLSGLNIQWNRFTIYRNAFTFDDILPNNTFALNGRYVPQDSFFVQSTVNVPTGTYYEIDLGIDRGVSNNQYQWYKNGLPYGPVSNSNTLVFDAIDWTDAGVYHCQVTNPDANLLTLYSRATTLSVFCGTSTNIVDDVLCEGEQVFIHNQWYDENQATGTHLLAGQDQYGCDSIIDVQLQFTGAVTNNLVADLCPGEVLVVNGQTYDANQLNGTELMTNAAANGCDSIVEVQLQFLDIPESTIQPRVCGLETYTLEGQVFDINRPTGSITLNAAAANGCDSIVHVELQVFEEPAAMMAPSLCPGEQFILHGQTFDVNQPMGTVVLPNASSQGCDSTIQVEVNFLEEAIANVSPALCTGESYSLQGQIFDVNQPTGTVVLDGAAANDCDSIVQVAVNFMEEAVANISPFVCEGESYSLQGQTFDANQPTGTIILNGAAANGCDSTLQINLQILSAPTASLSPGICAGGSYILEGQVFDASQPNGTVVLANAATNGCDSIVEISLQIDDEIEVNLSPSLCPGESLTIQGQTFDANQPSGTLNLTAVGGCDSTVYVDLQFIPQAIAEISPSICAGGQYVLDGQVFDSSHPNGLVILANASAAGCDSIVLVSLQIADEVFGMITPRLCEGESFSLAGQVFDANQPNGSVVLAGAASSGCDSIVQVNLQIAEAVTASISPSICQGGEFMLGGQVFDSNQLTGTVVLPNAAANGCDSIVEVNVQIGDVALGFLNPSLCPGGSFSLGGQVFDEAHPSGSVTLANGSVSGCDSVVQVDLNFWSPVEAMVFPFVCPGESVELHGQTFDSNHPNGQIILANAATNGCDSILQVEVQFIQAQTAGLSLLLCTGEYLSLHGQTFDEENPQGSITLAQMASNGCDSIIQVQLEYQTIAELSINPTLCPGEFIDIQGSRFDEDQPTGTIGLPAAAANGCDSIILVDLTYYEEANGALLLDLCPGESINLGGQTFDQNFPSGAVRLIGASSQGCDSLVQVDLSFMMVPESFLQPRICPGSSFSLNGETFNENVPTGTVQFSNTAMNGCDSIVHVELIVLDQPMANLEQTLCAGEVFSLHGESFDENQPSGTIRLAGAASNGCDSLIEVSLEFLEEVNSVLALSLCDGEQVVVNGQVYDENQASGIEVLSGAAANGCDSTVVVNLSFNQTSTLNWTDVLCSGESLEIAGQLFDEDNPTGSIVLEGANSVNCDSIIWVDLQFGSLVEESIQDTICGGVSYLFANGQSLNEAGAYSYTFENATAFGCDSTINLNLFVEDAAAIGYADAGENQVICEDQATLSAMPNGYAQGQWTSPIAVDFDDRSDEEALVNRLSPGFNLMIWTLSTDRCAAIDSDSLYIFVEAAPIAIADEWDLVDQPINTLVQLLDNDEPELASDWELELLTLPQQGSLQLIDEGEYQYTPQSLVSEADFFTYRLCNALCPDLCDTARVSIRLPNVQDTEPITEALPNAITPNDDGVNDYFIVPILEDRPDLYPDADLTIFNRWGDVVYRNRQYLNNWNGFSDTGQALPEGTYYFVLRLDLNAGLIFKGDLTILR
ncbi:MAG: gliding motility-associated C-terminal domain-containing protein [Bacteroidota bacterium]